VYSAVVLIGDVGFSTQVPKLLLNLGLEEPLVHGSAQITDRGMVSVPFPHLSSFNTVCMQFAFLKFSPSVGSEAEF